MVFNKLFTQIVTSTTIVSQVPGAQRSYTQLLLPHNAFSEAYHPLQEVRTSLPFPFTGGSMGPPSSDSRLLILQVPRYLVFLDLSRHLYTPSLFFREVLPDPRHDDYDGGHHAQAHRVAERCRSAPSQSAMEV